MVLMRKIELGTRGDVVTRMPDGSLIVSSPEALKPYPGSYTDRFAYWAREAPDRLFLAQRNAQGAWTRITYSEAYATVRRLAQALIDRNLSQERPLAVLSGNSIEHALMALAAMHVGIVVSPISVAFSLLSRDYVKLRHTLDLLEPGLVFVDDLKRFEPALTAVLSKDVEIVCLNAQGASLEATPTRR